jgi:hypothetical protein
VDATGWNLYSARHPLLPLICLESERSLSAHPSALLLHLIHLKHLPPPQNAELDYISFQRQSASNVIVTSKKHEKRLGTADQEQKPRARALQ